MRLLQTRSSSTRAGRPFQNILKLRFLPRDQFITRCQDNNRGLCQLYTQGSNNRSQIRFSSPSKMSWMDSWSRPSKSQATPPPYYLLPGGDKVQYCKTCGRLIGDRKKQAASNSATPAKYCSARCRGARHNRNLEQKIEDTFVTLLNGEALLDDQENSLKRMPTPPYKGGRAPKNSKKKKKGESRILVECVEVERIVFGERNDPEKCFGRRRNRARRGVKEVGEWKSVDMVSDDEGVDEEQVERVRERLKKGVIPRQAMTIEELGDDHTNTQGLETDDSGSEDDQADGGVSVSTAINITTSQGPSFDTEVLARLSIRSGTRIRPRQETSEVNGGIGGEKGVKERIEESNEMLIKRREGQRKAEERELVRCIARRGVAFGFVTKSRGEDGEEKRACEAVMQGKVVESSFAKGEWGVRWRE